ncbi:transient receptor potential cation channel subfamily V member 5-like [Tachypleus tridentatus]|uniref:transient receptor potential cation channel subfamily V member 5-like n=1 Tax=Tachypleus tridentatus TaxID=6853 RepID=UPI003FD27BA7
MGNCLPPHITSDKDGAPSSVSNNVLEQAVSHGSAGHELYKLANYQKGGSLVDAYHQGGSREVEKIATQELPSFMYGNGEGAVLRHELYVQWRQGRHKEVTVPVDNLVTSASSTTKPTSDEYRICWRLDCRGMLGESLLHVLILCNTAVHTRIARVLLKLYPRMTWDFIEGEEYLGAGVLHLGIAYQNTEIFNLGISSDVNVNQRATGRFFLPYDQQRKTPKKQSDFKGLCYMGEYALAWAACCEDESAYNMLLNHGANPNLQDTYGNMILHVVVVRDKLNMYGYALRHPISPAKDNILNKYGLTPLTLACKLGRNDIFREMLELSAMEFWRYSNITCSGYPLNALDSILPNGQTNWNSALIIILNGKTNEHLDMLDGGVIQRLLEEKWKTFARNEFLKRLAITFLHLIVLSIAVYLRPLPGEGLFGTDIRSVCRYAAEVGTCLGAVSFVVFQQGEEIKAQGLLGFLFSLSSNPSKAVFLFANTLVLLCVPLRLAEQPLIEDLLLTIAITGSWFFLIFFAGAVKLTGPFVTMIYNMLVGDIFRFSIIYVIFLLGFTQTFYFLFKGHLGKTTKFESYPRTWMSLFHMTLGFYEYQEFNNTLYPTLTWLVFALFMIIMPILLLNMLIAMMGNTYCEVITQSQKEWVNQWAKIVVALERGVSQKKAREFIQSYSIPFRASSPEEDPKKEIRAVMVIKSKSKSKARQRKGAICNWKRMGKRIIHELRQPGVTSTSLLKKFNSTCTSKLLTGSDDDSDSDTKQEFQIGLESALKQLAFASDLNLTTRRTLSATGESATSIVTAGDSSLGNVLQQVAWTHNSKMQDNKTRAAILWHVEPLHFHQPLKAINFCTKMEFQTVYLFPRN